MQGIQLLPEPFLQDLVIDEAESATHVHVVPPWSTVPQGLHLKEMQNICTSQQSTRTMLSVTDLVYEHYGAGIAWIECPGQLMHAACDLQSDANFLSRLVQNGECFADADIKRQGR